MCLRWFFGLYSGYTITYFSNSLTVLMLLKKDGSHRKPKGNKIIQFTKQTQPGNYFSRGHLSRSVIVGKVSIFFYFEVTILRSRKKITEVPIATKKIRRNLGQCKTLIPNDRNLIIRSASMTVDNCINSLPFSPQASLQELP